ERLPQLDAIPFRVHGPSEAAELGLVDLLVDRHAGGAELRQHGVEVGDAIVDHERLVAWVEVARGAFEDRPDRVAELRAAPLRVDVDAEVLAVPAAERVGVVGLEEDAADAGDFFHQRSVNNVARSRATTLAAKWSSNS